MKTVRGLGRGWGVLWASTSLEYFSNDNSIKMRHQIEISTEKISNMRLSFEAQFKTEFNGGKKCSEFPLQMNPAQPYWVGVTLSDPHWYSTKTHWAPNDPPLTHNDPPFRPQPTWIPQIIPQLSQKTSTGPIPPITVNIVNPPPPKKSNQSWPVTLKT